MMIDDSRNLKRLKEDLQAVLAKDDISADALQKVCRCLCDGMDGCDWAGYYLVDPNDEGQLFLGPFCGEPTEHTRIAFGKGICGQAAATLKTFLVDDVSSESNYLSCSPSVRSEIVVPVFFSNELVGEIDLDSHSASAFGEDERELLEWLAHMTSASVQDVRRGRRNP